MAKLVVALALSAQALAQQNLTSGAQTGTIYLIRPGEKKSGGCESHQGLVRAGNMYDVFKAKFDVPEYVFAWTYQGFEFFQCQRCHQTAEPIATRIGMSGPDESQGDYTCYSNWGLPAHCLALAGALKDKLSDHNVVMMVAEHNHIPRIAYGLGVSRSDIPDWDENEYDTVFKMKFNDGKLTSFTVHKQGQFPTPHGSDTLVPGEKLGSGDVLDSASGSARLSMQWADGNLVLRELGHLSYAVWSSHTTGHPKAELHFQSDGNLVLYDDSNVLWSSGSNHGAASLQLQDDCNLVIRDGSGNELWSLGTSCRREVTV